jgi:hypothetical protein
MPPVIISELDMQANGLIQAATYGRGTFQINPGTIGCASPSPIAFGQNVNGNLQLEIVFTQITHSMMLTLSMGRRVKNIHNIKFNQFNAYLLLYQGSYRAALYCSK